MERELADVRHSESTLREQLATARTDLDAVRTAQRERSVLSHGPLFVVESPFYDMKHHKVGFRTYNFGPQE